jgi:hypothetical protein
MHEPLVRMISLATFVLVWYILLPVRYHRGAS